MRSYASQPIGTVPERRRLRRELKESFPRLKWRHQSPVGPYKPDILCFSEKLIVEVDGDTHADTPAQDATRSAFLNRQGYHVIRFTNADVMRNLDGVIAAVTGMLNRPSTHSPSPVGEGGSRAPARRKGEDRLGGSVA